MRLLPVGENKIHFIPGMIGPFLGVTLVPQVEVRNIMIPIFHDMMDWEQRKNGNFKQVRSSHATVGLLRNTTEEEALILCVYFMCAGGGRADRQAGQFGF